MMFVYAWEPESDYRTLPQTDYDLTQKGPRVLGASEGKEVLR